jgi:hypothetical protein
MLKPRAGGIHTVLGIIGDELTNILIVSLIYPGIASPTLTDFLLGRIPRIVMRLETFKLGEKGMPSLETIRGKGGALAVRKFLNESWSENDKMISKIHSESKSGEEIYHPTSEPSSTESVSVSNTTSFSSE